MQKYIFPINYKFSAKFLGFIDYSVLLPLSIYSAIIIGILFILNLDFFISFSIFIILIVPPLFLLATGINGQPTIPYFIAIYKFHKNSKFYLYKNNCKKVKKNV